MKGETDKTKNKRAVNILFGLHKPKTEGLIMSWRNQRGVCIAVSYMDSSVGFSWLKLWNSPTSPQKVLLSEGKSLVCTENPFSEAVVTPSPVFMWFFVRIVRRSQ